MRFIQKMGILSLSAVLTFGLSAHAADFADPEGSAPENPSVSAPMAENDVQAPPISSATVDPEAAAVAAVPTPAPAIKKLSVTKDPIRLDGTAAQPAGYNINDENYFKLRDIAHILNGKKHSFSIGYDQAKNSITLTAGAPYVSVGGELAAATANPKATPSTAQVLLDGKPIAMTSYNINGNNYFRLRDIGTQIGFGVDYIDQVITLTSGPAITHTLRYDMNGHGAQIADAAIGEGLKPSAPPAPVAEGYLFEGWFQDAACKTAWDFAANTVVAETTLYAKWTKTHTVTFSMNGMGAPISPLTGVLEGSKITEPAQPSGSGYIFNGWYLDSELKTAWNFQADTVSADMTLYAKWSQMYTMTFDMNGYGAQVPPQTDIADGSFAKEPTPPTATGFTFGGWYIDKEGYTPWVFNLDRVAQDIIVYAHWIDNSTGTAMPPTGGTTPPATPDNSSAIDGTITILIDPGHGGTDPGTSGSGMDENRLNLAIAQPLREMLESAGVTVLMTREDTTTTLKGTNRKNYVESICSQGNIDFVISIHHNAVNRKASGAEIFVQTAKVDPNRLSKQLGQLLMEEYKKLGQTSRGVKDSGDLYMVYTSAAYGVPALLSEFCFIDNPADAAKIDSPEEQRAEAQAIYNAIMLYFQTHPF